MDPDLSEHQAAATGWDTADAPGAASDAAQDCSAESGSDTSACADQALEDPTGDATAHSLQQQPSESDVKNEFGTAPPDARQIMDEAIEAALEFAEAAGRQEATATADTRLAVAHAPTVRGAGAASLTQRPRQGPGGAGPSLLRNVDPEPMPRHAASSSTDETAARLGLSQSSVAGAEASSTTSLPAASSSQSREPANTPATTKPSAHRRRNLGLIFSPLTSPCISPPDTPRSQSPSQIQHQRSIATKSLVLEGPAPHGTAAGQQQPKAPARPPKPQLRALPRTAYRRRRTPIDEVLANFNMTRVIGKYLEDKVNSQHNDPRLNDLQAAAERLRGTGSSPSGTGSPGRRGVSARESPSRSVHQLGAGRDGTDESSERYWEGGELLGSPPAWEPSDQWSSRPGSAYRRGGGTQLLHQDSGDGRHQGMTGLSAYQGLASHVQGAYLTFPEYSFGGSRPLKATAERTVLFEKYGHKDEPACAVQQFYLRPDRSALIGMQQVAVQQQQEEQQMLLSGPMWPAAAPEEHLPPKTLPNGVPLSRLEQLREVQETTRARMVAAARKHKGALQVAAPGELPPEPDESEGPIRAEASTVLTFQDTVKESMQMDRRSYSRALSTKASMPRPLSTLMAELESAASTAVALGLTTFQTAPDTAEPVLDPHFFASMKSHFNQLAEDQTIRLQGKLNTGLPTILRQFGVKHVTAQVSGGTGRRTGQLPC